MIHVGCSGWQYDDWRGRVYPAGVPRRSWLALYAERFSTVEVNSSFYHLPRPGTFAKWHAATPPGFVITVKASRYITHVRRLGDCREPLETLMSRARELGDKLGPVLFQLPPRFAADPPLLRAFTRVLPVDVRAAFEFRDASWFVDDVYTILDEARAALVLADRPGVRVPQTVTGGWCYLRFHQGNASGPDYRAPKLRRWAERIAHLPASDVFAYFNNDPTGAAARDAETLLRLLRIRDLEVAGRQDDPAEPIAGGRRSARDRRS